MLPSTIISSLAQPFSAIVIEAPKGTYRNFGASSDYPLKGVTYPVDYGYLPGYIGEDKAELDFFVGKTRDGLSGFIRVFRPDTENGETKFFIAVTEENIVAICEAFRSVLLECKTFRDQGELLKSVELFRSDMEASL